MTTSQCNTQSPAIAINNNPRDAQVSHGYCIAMYRRLGTVSLKDDGPTGRTTGQAQGPSSGPSALCRRRVTPSRVPIYDGPFNCRPYLRVKPTGRTYCIGEFVCLPIANSFIFISFITLLSISRRRVREEGIGGRDTLP